MSFCTDLLKKSYIFNCYLQNYKLQYKCINFRWGNHHEYNATGCWAFCYDSYLYFLFLLQKVCSKTE